MMLDADSLLLFMVAAITLNVTPGPDMLYVIARSVGQGRMAGIVSVLGGALGCFVHILAVTLGLASLMNAVPAAYEIVKYAGAAYLLYLGVRTLSNRQSRNSETPIKEANLRTIFIQGVITSVLNPKVALFFLAFLPQFINHKGSVAAQIIFLGLLFNTTGTFIGVLVALMASYTGNQLRVFIKNSSLFRWLTGGVFIGLGIRLALLERK